MEKTDAIIDARTAKSEGRYTVTCRYCGTHVMGNVGNTDGLFTTIALAAKALQGHLKFSCEKAPAMPSRWRDRVVAASITVVEPT